MESQFFVFHPLEAPFREGTTLPSPREGEWFSQRIDDAHRLLRHGTTAPLHPDCDLRRPPVTFHRTFFEALLDGEEKELAKPFLHGRAKPVGIVAPLIEIIRREKFLHRPPISPLDGLQKMLLMQLHLPFRLPEPGHKERKHDETARDGSGDFFPIHERD